MGFNEAMCFIFGHKYKLRRIITPYIRELHCTRCYKQFAMNDQVKEVLPLDDELYELHKEILAAKRKKI